MIVTLSVAAMLGLGVPQDTAVPTPPAVKPAKEKKLCRTEETTTGSIVPSRTCHTAAEWQSIDDANATSVENFRNRNQGAPSISRP